MPLVKKLAIGLGMFLLYYTIAKIIERKVPAFANLANMVS